MKIDLNKELFYKVPAIAVVGTFLAYYGSQLNAGLDENVRFAIQLDLISSIAFSAIGAIVGRAVYGGLRKLIAEFTSWDQDTARRVSWLSGVVAGSSAGYWFVEKNFCPEQYISFYNALPIAVMSAAVGRWLNVQFLKATQ